MRNIIKILVTDHWRVPLAATELPTSKRLGQLIAENFFVDELMTISDEELVARLWAVAVSERELP